MSRDLARRTLVAYDVPDDKRRLRLAKCLETYGDRVQYSVFVIDCSPAKLARMTDDIEEIIRSEEDSVLLCDLGLVMSLSDKVFRYIGRSRDVTDDEAIVL